MAAPQHRSCSMRAKMRLISSTLLQHALHTDKRQRGTAGHRRNTNMASVAVHDIRKAFGATQVIHGVSIAIDDGEFVVLVGPSGCGKSTLLRMIAGLENITGGEIRIGDRVVNHLPPKARDVAMVFQNYALYPHMTVA